MKFDVVIGNPPYQRKVNEGAEGAPIYKPAYADFIKMALRIKPKCTSMIVPAKWYSDKQQALAELRYALKDEGHLEVLVDYKDSMECFENVRVVGGITYFLYNNNYTGNCTITNISRGKANTVKRDIAEGEYIIRDNIGVQILNKVKAKTNYFMGTMTDSVASSYFAIKDNNKGYMERKHSTDYEILSSENNSMAVKYIGYDDVQKNREVAEDEYKLVIGKLLAGGGDHPVDKNGMMKIISGIYVAKPGQVFVSTYLMVMHSPDKSIVENCEKYIKTKFVRFMLYLGIAGLNFTTESFRYVPMQSFEKVLTDVELYEMYDLSEEEKQFIEAFIKEIN